MKKITDIIVKYRYLFLITFVILSIFCLYLSKKVVINEDIMDYLPDDSKVKIGKVIMEREFDKEDTSSLNVMFKNLSNSEKKETYEKLKKIENVSSVDYDESDKYNIDNYTLYTLNVNDYSDSKTSENVYNYVKDNFKYSAMSGSIYDENKPILQLWIVILAISCAMIILIILNDYWLEPFLYLIAIGMAVFINKGTNIMFDSVSSITNSIAAILQLALSMDYSIMLSNRYKQEKEKNKNKVEAMKEALYQSFSAISSSSVTTVVGLLALIFMSFTIGKDLGLVLAKGVLLSLISIFFCLPALLLLFDNLILKTKKKSPNFKLNKLGAFCYKTRYIQVVLIILLFCVSYLLKGNINVLYTGSEQDEVGKVFKSNNQMAIVYENKYEKEISEYCKKLEQNKKIKDVLCYSNTLNEKLTYDKLNNKFDDLNQDTKIEDELLKLIYYNYYKNNSYDKLTLNDFVSFIKSDIYTNDKFNDRINDSKKDSIEKLSNFTNIDKMNKRRNISDLSNILDIDESDLESILILNNSNNISNKLTIGEFINFILNDVVNDSKYKNNIDSKTINDLKQLSIFTNEKKFKENLNTKELSNIFKMNEETINKLLLFYKTTNKSNIKLTIKEFANFALNLSNNDDYKNMFDKETISKLELLLSLTNEQVINNELSIENMQKSLSNFGLDIDSDSLKLLYILYSGSKSNTKITLDNLSNFMLNLYDKNEYKKYFSEEDVVKLNKIQSIKENKDKTFSSDILYSMFNISDEDSSNINLLITGDSNGTYNMTLTEFVNTLLSQKSDMEELNNTKFIIDNLNNSFSSTDISGYLNKDKLIISFIYGLYDNNIQDISLKELINFIYDNKSNDLLSKYNSELINTAYIVINNLDKKFNVSEISKLTNNSEEIINKIFGLYDYTNNENKISIYDMVNFILNNKDNEMLKDNLNNSLINKLNMLKTVMNSTINNKKYDYNSLSSLLGIKSDKVKLIYSLYDFKHSNNNSISLYNLVNFITKDVMNNEDYSSKFSNNDKEKLNDIKSIMNDSKNKKEYSSNETYNKLHLLSKDIDENLVDLVYLYNGSVNEYNNSWELTIEEIVNYLNNDILNDDKFNDFIDKEKKDEIIRSKNEVDKNKGLLVSKNYSRVVLNTEYEFENEETYEFVKKLNNDLGSKDGIYIVGYSPMAVEMDKSFNNELNKITILTIAFIFLVVCLTFKDLIIPFVLVLIIQSAVFVTESYISLTGGNVFFISLLIVQAILMGATIDYAIVYTSYYLESRKTMGVKDSIINAYNGSIHTILNSSTILIVVTLDVAFFASAIAAKICETISQGTFCSVILILFMLPGVLAASDKLICRKGYYKEK